MPPPLIRAIRASPTWRIASTVYLTLLCYTTIGLPLAVIPAFARHALGFDAVGGGRLASDILAAMEQVASEGQAYSRYGSSSRKKVYIYGALDLGPTTLSRTFGLSWDLGGWLLTNFLNAAGRWRPS